MASLLNTKISNTYVGLIKTLDNAVISSSLKELSDGSGNATGIHINNAGDLKVTNILEFGSLKDTGENITISKFVDAADGIGSNNNDTTIPTSAAVATYVAAQITLEDLDFSGDSGTGSVDLDSQVFAVVGTANEIETSAGSQQLQIGLPNNVTISGNLQVNGLLKGNNNIVIKDTSDRTMAAFYGGDKVELYFNDSKKFETTSGGATVTGGITATGGSVFTSATFSGNVVLDDNSGASPQIQFINGNNDTGEILLNSSGKLEISTGGTDRLIISSGDTEFTGDISLPDEVKLRVGSSNDLEIYHDSNNSYIQDTGTGGLRITSDVLRVLDTTNAEVMIKAEANAGVELYYDNSKKFETTNTGVTVTGVVVSDGLSMGDNEQIRLGDGEDLRLFHNGTDSSINNYNGDLYITNQADDKDIIFRTDDGTGGFTEYFRLDGGNVRTLFSKNIKLSDSVYLLVGSGNDLQLLHNGTNSFIINETGNLAIRNTVNDGDITFESDDGSGGVMEYFRLDGGNVNMITSVNNVFVDNKKVQFGDSADLAIYHDGTNSIIDNNTNDLIIRCDSDDIKILSEDDIVLRDNDDSTNFIHCINGGAVKLYYNGSEKFETTAGGVSITGTIDSTGTISVTGASSNIKVGTDTGKIMAGASNDLQIYHDGSHSRIDDTGTGKLILRGNTDVEIHKYTGEYMLTATADGAVSLYFDDSKKFETTNTGVSVTGVIASSGNITISNASPTLTLTDTDNSNDITFNSVGGALVLNSTSDQVFQIGGTEKFRVGSTTATFAGSVTIAQDLTVNGTTTTVNTSTLAVEDPLISMAKDNSANSVDVGFYGRYNDGSNRYLGLFADASDSNTFSLFKGTTTEPTTTVDTTATGYTLADLNVGNVALGDNTKITFGAVPDFEIFHNSTTNVNHIQSLLDRQLALNGNTIFLRNQDNDTNFLQINSTDASFGGNVNIPDSKNLNIGTSNDLFFVHNGSNSFMQNANGDLFIEQAANDKDIIFRNDDGSGGLTPYFTIDGSATTTVFSKNTRHDDNVLIQVGAGNDAAFYHQGTDTFITNSTGHLKIRQFADDKDIIFDCDDGSGGVTEYFRLDGGAAKNIASKALQFFDNVKAEFGDSSDLAIFHDGSHSRIQDLGSGHLTINATDFVVNNSADTKNMIIATDGGSVKLYHNASERFETTSTGATVTGDILVDGGNITLGTDSVAGNVLTPSDVLAFTVDSNANTGGTPNIQFKVGSSEKMRLTNTGLGIGTTSSNRVLEANSNESDVPQIRAAYNSTNYLDIKHNILNAVSSGGNDSIQIQTGGTTALTIDVSQNATFTGDVTVGSNSAAAPRLFFNKAASGNAEIKFNNVGSEKASIQLDSAEDLHIFANTSQKIKLRSGGADTLTLDASQNATFAGDVTFSNNDVAKTIKSSVNGGAIQLIGNHDSATNPNRGLYLGRVNNNGVFTSSLSFINGDDATFAGNVQVGTSNANFQAGFGVAIADKVFSYGAEFQATNADIQIVLGRNNGTSVQGTGAIGASGTNAFHVYDTSSVQQLFQIAQSSGNATFNGAVGVGVTGGSNAKLEVASTSGEVFRADASGGAFRIVANQTGVSTQGTFSHTNGNATFANTEPLTPIIKAKSNQLNGYTFLGDNYASDESQVTIGIQYSSAGLVLGQGVKPSNDTNNKYLSTQDTYANKSSALVMAGGDFKFKNTSTSATTTTNTEVSLSERMRISNDGRLFLGTALGNIGAAQLSLQTNGGRGYGFNDTSGNSGTKANIFHSQATEVGSISINSSSTAYNTSSDYRLKEDLKDFAGLDIVSKIPVYDFKWKADDNRGYGVMAHELEEVLPQAVTGEKDAEDMQGVDYSKIVPLLVKSIQELKKEVDTLKKECKCN